MDPGRKPGFSKASVSAAMGLAGAGLQFAGVVLVMTLGGWWLDRKLDSEPWLMLLGAAIGIIGGLYKLWRLGKRYF